MTLRRTAALASLLLLLATAPACSGGSGASGDSGNVPFVAVDAKNGSPTDQAIAKAQAKLRANKRDLAAKLDLAQGFLQKARETADPSLYTKAAKLLDQLDQEAEPSPSVLITEGTLALAQHRFADALKLGTQALKMAPDSEGALGVLFDANNELGNYAASLKAGERMVETKPNLASLSRASYARELRGDLDGAILAMTQAVTTAASQGGENQAYVQTLLGNLLLIRGDVSQAWRSYAEALQAFPDYPAAKAGQAMAMVAQGKFAEAGDLLKAVVDVQPLDTYAIAEGDAYTAAGRKADAKAAYDLVGAIAQLYRANGVNVDLELALYEADHNPGPKALAQARKALKNRPSILGHDGLAWNLYRTKQYKAAAEESKKALATGDKDPLLQFHAAAIAEANGDTAAAKDHLQIVLDGNPRFSAFLIPEVEALAKKLGLAFPPPAACAVCT